MKDRKKDWRHMGGCQETAISRDCSARTSSTIRSSNKCDVLRGQTEAASEQLPRKEGRRHSCWTRRFLGAGCWNAMWISTRLNGVKFQKIITTLHTLFNLSHVFLKRGNSLVCIRTRQRNWPRNSTKRLNQYSTDIRNSYLTHSSSWALLEKPPIVQLLQNFPAFYGKRRFITAFT
jgi:hypothetical protein